MLTLVIPGGTQEGGTFIVVGQNPALKVGEHVLVFGRLRDLFELGKVSEANALRLADMTGVYRRIEGEMALVGDSAGLPLASNPSTGPPATFPPHRASKTMSQASQSNWSPLIGMR